jgi:hypothetical protein
VPKIQTKRNTKKPIGHRRERKTSAPSSSAIVRRPDSLAATVSEQIENILIIGDLKNLTAEQRVEYAKAFAKSLGINILTRPFDYILFREYDNSPERLELYLNAKGAAQLRKIHRISIIPGSLKRVIQDEHCMVSVDVRDGWGSTDSATGSVSLFKFKDGRKIPFAGREWDNAIMKSETKAKRRATLSICGLAMLDESQLDTMIVTGGVTPEGRIFRYPGVSETPQIEESIEAEVERQKAGQEPSSLEELRKSAPTQPESRQTASPEGQHPAQGVAGAASTGHASPSGRKGDVQVTPDRSPSESPVLGTVELDWTNEQSPILRGDIAGILEVLKPQCHLKWEADSWWHFEPRDANAIRQVCKANRLQVKEIKPSVSGAGPLTEKAKAESKGASPTAPALVSGTVERVFPTMKGGKPFAMITLAQTGKKFEAGCWNKTVFTELSKGLGKIASVIVEKRGEYTNVTGLRQIGSTEYDEHSKAVIQQNTREAGGRTLFP